MRLRALVAVQAALGGAALLAVFFAASSHAPESTDSVEMGFLPDGRLFQNNRDRDRLRVEGQADLPLDAWQVLPLSDGFLVLRHERDIRRHRAVLLSPTGEERATGPWASAAAPAPSGAFWLAGDGTYLTNAPGNTASIWTPAGGRAERSLDGLFARDLKSFRYDGVGGLAVSPDGRRLAASAWAYNIGAALALWDLEGGAKVMETDDHGGFLAFTPDSKLLVAVRSHGAQVRIRTFDAATGRMTASTEEMSGSAEALAVEGSGRRLAISRAGFGNDTAVELFEVEGLRPVASLRWPDARYPAALRFEGDGLLLGGASGSVWRRTDDGRLSRVRRAWPAPVDVRWLLPAALVLSWAAVWIPAVRIARRPGIYEGAAPAFGKRFLIIVAVAEAARIAGLLINASFVISQPSVIFVGLHLVAAGGLILYGLSLRILGAPIRKVAFLGTALLAGVGAAMDLFITVSAIASV